MNVVIVCQARLGSSRLPRKVLLPLSGRSIIEHFLERVSRSTVGSTIVVATTTDGKDDELVDRCRLAGYEVFRGHPTDLLDRHYRVGMHYEADVVVKIPSDCPLIDPTVIDRVIRTYLSSHGRFDFVSNLHPASYPDGNDVEVMSMQALETAWRCASHPHEREHTTPWFWDGNPDIRCLNVSMEGGMNLSMTHRWTVDYPEDYLFVNAVYEALYRESSRFGLADVLRLVQEHPEIAALNSQLAGVNWYGRHLGELRTISPAETRPYPAL